MKDVEIFVIAGSSGCGKDTLTADFPSLSYLHDLDPKYYNSEIYKLVPFTTRDKRPGEIDGVTYDFFNKYDIIAFKDNHIYTQNFRIHFSPKQEYYNLDFYECRSYHVITNEGKSKTDYYGNFIGKVVPGKKYVIIGQFDTYKNLREHVKNMDTIFGCDNNVSPRIIVKLIWLTLPLKEKIRRLVKRENEKENPNMEELIRRILADEKIMDSETITRDLFYKVYDSRLTGEHIDELFKNVCIFDTCDTDKEINKAFMRKLIQNPDYFKNNSLFQEIKEKIILDESISSNTEVSFYRTVINEHKSQVSVNSLDEMVYYEDRFMNYYMETALQNKKLLKAIFNDT